MKIIDFVKESFAELKKVNWPSREDVFSQTLVVVVSLLVVSVLLAIMDIGSMQFISKIISLGK